MNIKESADYVLTTGPSLDKNEDDNVYIITNKVTGVVEVDTRLLAQAYEYIDQLQSHLDARRDKEATVGGIGPNSAIITPLDKTSH